MNDYTARDKKNYGDTDIAKVAYPKFQEKLPVCQNLFHGFDYSAFINADNLARSSLATKEERIEADFFESVRVLVNRLTEQGGGTGHRTSLKEINARISELLKASIHSDGVINLFRDANEEFSLFDPKFLEEIANMKEKNLAVELLKKLIAEQVVVSYSDRLNQYAHETSNMMVAEDKKKL